MRWAQDVVEEPDFQMLACDRSSCSADEPRI
jgi:hypothetical protein